MLKLVDLDGDGKPELLAGKRYRGHNGNDPGSYDPLVIYYYRIDTETGKLRARIPVGAGPHGLCVWPQPGRYSLGHTGIMR